MPAHQQHKGSAGRLPDSRIGPQPKRVSKEIITRFEKLKDMAGTVSDVLDQMGIVGCVGTSSLRPTIASARVVGTAITVRNVTQRNAPYANAERKEVRMAEVEGINQAEPGDVLVIQGLRNISNMGGIMATIAERQGLAGAVVDGGIRDVGHSRSLNFPIWSKDISPVTGKWRAVTEEVNGPVVIDGISIQAGDLVIADETGVCFVPQHLVEEVIKRCEAAASKEDSWSDALDKGMSIPDIVKRIY